MRKKKKSHVKWWASLPVDKMLRGAFQIFRGIKKKNYTRDYEIF
jgi:hypothetical protein